MSFDNKSIPKKRGLKINNETSSVPPPKPDPVTEFNEQAQQAFSKHEDYKKRTWDLSTKFKSLLESKILPENKSELSKNLETEVLQNLVVLASEMNEDENQPEGIGSTALSFLLMKMMLVQRDTVNALLYKVEKLEKAIVKLESNKDK